MPGQLDQSSSSFGLEPMILVCFGRGIRLSRPLMDFQIASLSATSGVASSRVKFHVADSAAIGAPAPLTGASGSPNGTTDGCRVS